jgi:hypothetical protein
MTNGKATTVLMLIIALLIVLPISIAETKRIWTMTQPQQQQTEPTPPTAIVHQQQVGMAIMWRTPMQSGMSPREVLASTIARMQYEQTTLLGNDRNAKALVKAMEALAILEDRPTETTDGFPIIE